MRHVYYWSLNSPYPRRQPPNWQDDLWLVQSLADPPFWIEETEEVRRSTWNRYTDINGTRIYDAMRYYPA